MFHTCGILLFFLSFISADLTLQQKHTTFQITSCAENSNPIPQYGYAENLDDGRGITAGIAGFCSGTHDMILVIRRYNTLKPNNILSKYTARLEQLDKLDESDDITGLEGLINDWGKAASDPLFRQSQDDIRDQLYYNPSRKYADTIGLELPLSRAVVYDTIIQHGDGDDPDGLPRLLAETKSKTGGTPAIGKDEKNWLNNFLTIRKKHLSNAADPSTRDEWRESIDRVSNFQRTVKTGNYEMKLPMKITVYGDTFTLVADKPATVTTYGAEDSSITEMAFDTGVTYPNATRHTRWNCTSECDVPDINGSMNVIIIQWSVMMVCLLILILFLSFN